MGYWFNRSQDKDKRRQLRNSMTPTEILLWIRIKNGQLNGLMFRRQTSIGGYVVDFYLPQHKLAIEIDGPSHLGPEAAEYDQERQKTIEDLGVIFLRFTNDDVYNRIDWVLNRILNKVMNGALKNKNKNSSSQ